MELIKILTRYLVWVLVLVVLILFRLVPSNTIQILLYKVSNIITAYVLAEFIWHLSYKVIWGKLEDRFKVEDKSLVAISLFRGILYASIILGLTIGV